MGSILHGSARTTPRGRAERQAAQASTRAVRPEPEVDLQVAPVHQHGRHADGPTPAREHGPEPGRGGGGGSSAAPHPAAPGRG